MIRMSEAAFAFMLAAICAALALALVAITAPPKPIRADPQPAATCMVTQPQWLTPDVFVTPWRGALTPSYPCKLLKKEQDV